MYKSYEEMKKREHDLLTQRLEIYREEIAPYLPDGWEGAELVLRDRGFFDAPASTKYHGAYPGGLFDHSMNVTRHLVKLTENMELNWYRPESPWVIGFFHDLCKMDQYQRYSELTKEGVILTYKYRDDTLYKGHGDKSVMLLSTFGRLTEEEVACIRYHMGAFTEKEQWTEYTGAIHRFPNVLWTHTADMMAAHITEVDLG